MWNQPPTSPFLRFNTRWRCVTARTKSSCLLRGLLLDTSTSTTCKSSTTTWRRARFRTGSSGLYPPAKELGLVSLVVLGIDVTFWSCCGWPLTSIGTSSAWSSSPSLTHSIEWCRLPARRSCVRPHCGGSTVTVPSRCSDPVSEWPKSLLFLDQYLIWIHFTVH